MSWRIYRLLLRSLRGLCRWRNSHTLSCGHVSEILLVAEQSIILDITGWATGYKTAWFLCSQLFVSPRSQVWIFDNGPFRAYINSLRSPLVDLILMLLSYTWCDQLGRIVVFYHLRLCRLSLVLWWEKLRKTLWRLTICWQNAVCDIKSRFADLES